MMRRHKPLTPGLYDAPITLARRPRVDDLRAEERVETGPRLPGALREVPLALHAS